MILIKNPITIKTVPVIIPESAMTNPALLKYTSLQKYCTHVYRTIVSHVSF